MTILSRVCAEFRDKRGEVIYSIRPNDLMVLKTDVPEAIRQDPLFDWLLNDGSLDVVESVKDKKKLEIDPVDGANVEGKKERLLQEKKKVRKTASEKNAETEPEETAEAASEDK